MGDSPLVHLRAALDDPHETAVTRVCDIVLSNLPYATQMGRVFRRKMAEAADAEAALRILKALHAVLKKAAEHSARSKDRLPPIVQQWVHDRSLVCTVTAFAAAVADSEEHAARGRRRISAWGERRVLRRPLADEVLRVFEAFLGAPPPAVLASNLLDVPRAPLPWTRVPALSCLLLEEQPRAPHPPQAEPPRGAGASLDGEPGAASPSSRSGEPRGLAAPPAYTPPALRAPPANPSDAMRRAVDARRRIERERREAARATLPPQIHCAPGSAERAALCLRRWTREDVEAAAARIGTPREAAELRHESTAFMDTVARALRLEESAASMAHVALAHYWAAHAPSPRRDPPLVALACLAVGVKFGYRHISLDALCRGGHALLRRAGAYNVSVAFECERVRPHLADRGRAGAKTSRIPPPDEADAAPAAVAARAPACLRFHARRTLAVVLGLVSGHATEATRLKARRRQLAQTRRQAATGDGRSAIDALLGVGHAAAGGGEAEGAFELPGEHPLPLGPGPWIAAPAFGEHVYEAYQARVAPLEAEAVTGCLALVDALSPLDAVRLLAMHTRACPGRVVELAHRRVMRLAATRLWAVLTPTEVAAAAIVSAALSRGQLLLAGRECAPCPPATDAEDGEAASRQIRALRDSGVPLEAGSRARPVGLASAAVEAVAAAHVAWLRERVDRPAEVYGHACGIAAHFRNNPGASSLVGIDLADDALLLEPMGTDAVRRWLHDHPQLASGLKRPDHGGHGLGEPPSKKRP